jgi:thiol-disulfide isomerase/thioredoxin
LLKFAQNYFMRLFYIGLLAFLFVSCESKEYTINITADVADNEDIFFIVLDETNQPKTLDTLTIVDGLSSYSGTIDVPEMHYLMLSSNRQGAIPFILESGNITIEIFKDSIQKSVVSGTKSNKDFNDYMVDTEPIINDLFSIQNEMRNAMISRDSLTYVDLQDQFSDMQLKFENYQLDFVTNHPDSYISALVLEQLIKSNKVDVEEARPLYNAFSKILKKTRAGNNIKAYIAPEEEEEEEGDVQIGDVAPDFNAPSANGSVKTLYSSLGNFTIVDFWSSWCGPCRVESPQLVELYNTYKDKGLKIVGVSLDQNKENWLKAIENDNLAWVHVSNLKRWDDPIAAQYGVKSIPQLFLLDQKGTVLVRKTNARELEPFLASLLP